MPQSTARREEVALRWGTFLRAHVGADRPISVEALLYAFETKKGVEIKRESQIYAYLKCEQSIYAETAFEYGEALRDCGLTWCSGTVALFMAGYPKEFVTAVGTVAEERATDATSLIYGCNALRTAFNAVGAMPQPPLNVVLPNAGNFQALRRAQQRQIIRARRYAKKLLATVKPIPQSRYAALRGVHDVFEIAAQASRHVRTLPAHEIDRAVLLLIENLWTRPHRSHAVRSIAARSFIATPLVQDLTRGLYSDEIERAQRFGQYLETIRIRNQLMETDRCETQNDT